MQQETVQVKKQFEVCRLIASDFNVTGHGLLNNNTNLLLLFKSARTGVEWAMINGKTTCSL